mmetsp:Transcript_24441/g.35915  ORF Transcript_24441/g.35915 Transcript_24441/m.35915 type:complete len:163 (-) Transcript_24441:48-536(-)|eukprot:CAMPEP_0185040136 /NCGR_PEP_ID=MMETSP1103-20130426/37852_1 /TAXON_ID=36769 /ORGANISM="Paraphysomonas bandaiensis, Strain Caron Lab Isolate" /LENGTH=162 /DNA_ID=CAMNT_0027579317 /DNA_START=76 /DNA_END=564 /DNA_ORIENTATION=+
MSGYYDDLLWSSIAGIVLGGGILIVLQKYPGEPFDYSSDFDKEEISLNKKTDTEEKVVSVKDVIDDITEESVLEKTQKLQKCLGISDDVIREAVRKTKADSKKGIDIDDGVNIYKAIDYFIYAAFICGMLYFANIMTGGQIYRVFHGIFRREFEALNLPTPR